jgi:TRAP-type mannitol/chloroaromatic compound transport system permease large subunit
VGVGIKDIYIAVIPFIILQLLGVVIVSIFPQIALWLPRLIYGS